ncbi:MAG: peptidoglycan editing factor PgeF [Methylobacteriaceae bacterium]|nr:peptidoglycan editing factor PgeF [Methylobacteriaceae bacterium]
MIETDLLRAPGLAHAFFTREGGVSAGVYASLNGGIGSKDDARAVAENRRRMAARLGVDAARFLVPHQVHSPDAVIVEAPWAEGGRPRADGIVTAARGLGLGVTGADCGMILFADQGARVVGAAHAGWKGALTGVVESTLAAMERLGARRATTAAVVGPTIGPGSYEVGPEFVERFVAADAGNERHFRASRNAGHAMFDLPGYILARLAEAGVGRFQSLGLDTYEDEARFFSYRRSVHRREHDYGRLVAAIALV